MIARKRFLEWLDLFLGSGFRGTRTRSERQIRSATAPKLLAALVGAKSACPHKPRFMTRTDSHLNPGCSGVEAKSGTVYRSCKVKIPANLAHHRRRPVIWRSSPLKSRFISQNFGLKLIWCQNFFLDFHFPKALPGPRVSRCQSRARSPIGCAQTSNKRN